MLTLHFDGLDLELDDGTVKHVGGATAASAKLFDVADAEARAFGDERVKLAFTDDEGNEIEVALDPAAATAIRRGLDELADEGLVYE